MHFKTENTYFSIEMSISVVPGKLNFLRKVYTYWHCLFVYRVFQACHRTPEHYTDFVCILNLIWHVTWIVFPPPFPYRRIKMLPLWDFQFSKICTMVRRTFVWTVTTHVRLVLSAMNHIIWFAIFRTIKMSQFLYLMLFYLLMFLLRRNCQKLAKWWISSYLQVTLAIFKAGLYQNRNKYWIISSQKHRFQQNVALRKSCLLQNFGYATILKKINDFQWYF